MPNARLEHFAELERRYDGPIPEPEQLLARFGSAAAAEALVAAGNAAFYRSMLRQQVAIIRRRRAEGSAYPALLGDLGLYRERWRYWRQKQRLCAALLAEKGRR